MMSVTRSKLQRTISLICLILAGETIFFLPFVLARLFRPTFLNAFQISNLELGTCFSLYGVVAMISYFFGGALADKYPSRNLISLALWLTGLGGIVLVIYPTYFTLMIVYAYWGATTIFLLWSALIRATREWGTVNSQGKAFGLLEGGRGLAAAILGTVVLVLFSNQSSKQDDAIYNAQQNTSSFLWIVVVTSIITILCGFLVWVFVPLSPKKKASVRNKNQTIHTIIQIIKKPEIWLQSLIIICAYVGYKITDDYSLYANEVLGFNEIDSAKVGTTSLWIRPFIAILAGFLADKLKGSRITVWCFVLMLLGGFFIYNGVQNHILIVTFIILIVALIGIYSIRSIYFALMGEAKIPLAVTGTAVGIMSIIGYTPDIFMSPLMGYLLDNYPGVTGHQYVFLVFACFSLIGLLASITFRKVIKTKTA